MEPKFNLLRINNAQYDTILSYCALSQILLALIQDCIINIGVSVDIASKLRILSSLLLFLYTTLLTFKRIPQILLISYSIFISILCFSYVVFPQSHEYIFNDAIKYSIISISIVLSIISINNIDIFLKALTNISVFSSLIGILYGITWRPALADDESIYSMSLSYNLLLPSMVLLHSKRRLFKLLFFATFYKTLADFARVLCFFSCFIHFYETDCALNCICYNTRMPIFISLPEVSDT